MAVENDSLSETQLVLDLPERPALELHDFLVSRSNAAAVKLVDGWPQWPGPAAAVVGPAGSGKSHLTHVWRLRANAPGLAAVALGEDAIGLFEASGALAVEDMERGIGDERIFFHLLNLAREKSYSLLITSRVSPGSLDIALPDLRSRLRALPLVLIEPPDEGLLGAVLVKLFADRQLAVEPHVVGHLARYMERSMEAANKLVARCDLLSLSKQRRITRALAAEALAAEKT